MQQPNPSAPPNAAAAAGAGNPMVRPNLPANFQSALLASGVQPQQHQQPAPGNVATAATHQAMFAQQQQQAAMMGGAAGSGAGAVGGFSAQQLQQIQQAALQQRFMQQAAAMGIPTSAIALQQQQQQQQQQFTPQQIAQVQQQRLVQLQQQQNALASAATAAAAAVSGSQQPQAMVAQGPMANMQLTAQQLQMLHQQRLMQQMNQGGLVGAGMVPQQQQQQTQQPPQQAAIPPTSVAQPALANPAAAPGGAAVINPQLLAQCPPHVQQRAQLLLASGRLAAAQINMLLQQQLTQLRQQQLAQQQQQQSQPADPNAAAAAQQSLPGSQPAPVAATAAAGAPSISGTTPAPDMRASSVTAAPTTGAGTPAPTSAQQDTMSRASSRAPSVALQPQQQLPTQPASADDVQQGMQQAQMHLMHQHQLNAQTPAPAVGQAPAADSTQPPDAAPNAAAPFTPPFTLDQIRTLLQSNLMRDAPVPTNINIAKNNLRTLQERLMAAIHNRQINEQFQRVLMQVYSRMQIEALQVAGVIPPGSAAAQGQGGGVGGGLSGVNTPSTMGPGTGAAGDGTPVQSPVQAPVAMVGQVQAQDVIKQEASVEATSTSVPMAAAAATAQREQQMSVTPPAPQETPSAVPMSPAPSELSVASASANAKKRKAAGNESEDVAGDAGEGSAPASKKKRATTRKKSVSKKAGDTAGADAAMDVDFKPGTPAPTDRANTAQAQATPHSSSTATSSPSPAPVKREPSAAPPVLPPAKPAPFFPYERLPRQFKTIVTYDDMRAYVGREKLHERALDNDKRRTIALLDQRRSDVTRGVEYEKMQVAQHGSRLGPLAKVHRNLPPEQAAVQTRASIRRVVEDPPPLRVLKAGERVRAKRGWYVLRDFDFSREEYQEWAAGPSGADEELVSVRIDVEHDNVRFRDTLTWNANEQYITPETFAAATVADLGLPDVFRKDIAQAVVDQVADYQAWRASSVPQVTVAAPVVNAGPPETTAELVKQAIAQYLPTPPPSASADGQEVQQLEKQVLVAPVVPSEKGGWVTRDGMEDLRFLVKLHITFQNSALVDEFEWDLLGPRNSPELFAAKYCSELGLDGEYRTSIAHSIREQAQLHIRSLVLAGYQFDNSAIASISPDLAEHFLIPLDGSMVHRHFTLHDRFSPMFVEMTEEEAERVEKGNDRDTRRKRRTGRSMPRRSGGVAAGVVLVDGEPLRTKRSHFPLAQVPVWRERVPVPVVHNHVEDLMAEAEKVVVKLEAKEKKKQEGAVDVKKEPPLDAMMVDVKEVQVKVDAVADVNDKQQWVLDSDLNQFIETIAKNRVPTLRMRMLKDPPDQASDGTLAIKRLWWCANCMCPADATPVRRRGPGGTWLCNHCGLYFISRGEQRPLSPLIRALRPTAGKQVVPAHALLSPTSAAVPANAASPSSLAAAHVSANDHHHHHRNHSHAPPARLHFSSASSAANAALLIPPAVPIAPEDRVPAHAPEWMHHRFIDTAAKFSDAIFSIVQLHGTAGQYRIECHDCPGKTYAVGPGLSLVNFEVHLRTNGHVQRVRARQDEMLTTDLYHRHRRQVVASPEPESKLGQSELPVKATAANGGYDTSEGEEDDDEDDDDESLPVLEAITSKRSYVGGKGVGGRSGSSSSSSRQSGGKGGGGKKGKGTRARVVIDDDACAMEMSSSTSPSESPMRPPPRAAALGATTLRIRGFSDESDVETAEPAARAPILRLKVTPLPKQRSPSPPSPSGQQQAASASATAATATVAAGGGGWAAPTGVDMYLRSDDESESSSSSDDDY